MSEQQKKWQNTPRIRPVQLPTPTDRVLCNRCSRPVAWTWPNWVQGNQNGNQTQPNRRWNENRNENNPYFPPYYLPPSRLCVPRPMEFRPFPVPPIRRMSQSSSSNTPSAENPQWNIPPPFPYIRPTINPYQGQQKMLQEARQETRERQDAAQWIPKTTGPRFQPEDLPEYVFGLKSLEDRTEDDMEMIPDLDCSVWNEDSSKKDNCPTPNTETNEKSREKPYAERIKVCRERKIGQRRCRHFQKIGRHLDEKAKKQQ